MYQPKEKGWACKNGQWRNFFYRANTNDENTIQAVFAEDEYFLQKYPCRPNGVILDFGAHIGSFSILATTLFPRARILAFEPCAENFELFEKSIKVNHLENQIQANLKAVWGVDDEVIQIYFGDETAFGVEHRFNCSHFAGWGKTDIDKKFDIETVNLHRILEDNKIDRVDILKTDCEGSEYDIFNKSSVEDLKKIDLIVGEYHNILKPPFENPRQALLDSLHGLFEDITDEPKRDFIMPKILPDKFYHGDFVFRLKK